MSHSSQRSIFALLIVTIVAAAAVVVADSTTNNDYVHAYNHDGDLVAIPKVRIINWGSTVARFDSSNGAIYQFKGELNDYKARGVWVKAVAPVSGASGPLQIQNPVGVENFGATFLVDSVSGRTWLLQLASRARDDKGHGTWIEVKQYR